MRSPLGPILGCLLALACCVALAFADELGAGIDELSPQAEPPRPSHQIDRSRSSSHGTETERPTRRIHWHHSVATGLPEDGGLIQGVQLPGQGRSYFTWDPVLHRHPDRNWRRWATDDLIRTVLQVVRDYRAAHPNAPRVGVGDLSLPHGGDFGPEVGGGIGHATHQNGLNADIYYPRLDRRERPPERVDQIDLALAQDLVDRFVKAGAVRIFVGPNTPLTGPPEIVQQLVNHDNHLHVLIEP
jgi:hypothetical protein